VIAFVRHGETPPNRAGLLLGRGDVALTDHGRAQAKRLAEALAGLDVAHILASPLRRACDTAAPIATACGQTVDVDERLIEGRALEEVSLGDFVLSGGEIAAMALIDSCVRLLPGVMGREASGAEESFAEGLLEYPQYTRPQLWEERAIPEVLLSGDHGKIAAWRREQAERLTRERRPDLWAGRKR